MTMHLKPHLGLATTKVNWLWNRLHFVCLVGIETWFDKVGRNDYQKGGRQIVVLQRRRKETH